MSGIIPIHANLIQMSLRLNGHFPMPYGLDMPHMYVRGLIFSQSKQSLQDDEKQRIWLSVLWNIWPNIINPLKIVIPWPASKYEPKIKYFFTRSLITMTPLVSWFIKDTSGASEFLKWNVKINLPTVQNQMKRISDIK